MTNFEWLTKNGFDYQLKIDSLGCALHEKRQGYRDCDGECEKCQEESWKWLQQEYEPHLLENGDGLKTGDWIMVRNESDQDWRKLQFLFFWDGYFLTTDGVSTPDTACVIRWNQARLPIEGE